MKSGIVGFANEFVRRMNRFLWEEILGDDG